MVKSIEELVASKAGRERHVLVINQFSEYINAIREIRRYAQLNNRGYFNSYLIDQFRLYNRLQELPEPPVMIAVSRKFIVRISEICDGHIGLMEDMSNDDNYEEAPLKVNEALDTLRETKSIFSRSLSEMDIHSRYHNKPT